MDATTEKTLKQLEDMTEGMLRTLEQVDQIAQDFSRADGGRQQRELFSKVESLASGLEELHEVPIAPELTVPFAVLQHIDKAENPDLYWKQVVDTTVESVHQNKGRAEALHVLKDALGAELKGSVALGGGADAGTRAEAMSDA